MEGPHDVAKVPLVIRFLEEFAAICTRGTKYIVNTEQVQDSDREMEGEREAKRKGEGERE